MLTVEGAEDRLCSLAPLTSGRLCDPGERDQVFTTHTHTHTQHLKPYHSVSSDNRCFLCQKHSCGFLGAVVAGHVESCQSTHVLLVTNCPTLN